MENKFEKIKSEENQEEQKREIKLENVAEEEKPFDFGFYITDHSPDFPDTGSKKELRALYEDIKKDGIESVRYDWHWRNVEPQAGEYSQEHLARYKTAKETMEDVGLEEPTIILSNPPEWARNLYKENKEDFFSAYKSYVKKVKNSLEEIGGEKIKTVQILNELNNAVYTPVKIDDLPRLCQITREIFNDYNPDLKLKATLAVGNLSDYSSKFNMATKIKDYLPELKKIKDNFDIIAIDYYPGLWHLPLKEAGWKYKDVFKQLGLLRETFEEVATWGKEYELGEVGLPTNRPWGNEKRQRYFFDSFFRAFKHLMVDFRGKGMKLPSCIGLYEAIDEPPRTTFGKVLRKMPYPEHDMGLRFGSGERKMILEGNPHLPKKERIKKPSQLSKIISYLNAPMKKSL